MEPDVILALQILRRKPLFKFGSRREKKIRVRVRDRVRVRYRVRVRVRG